MSGRNHREIAPGDVFAEHTVIELIGRGGMGEVYLAQHPRLPRTVALKVLNAELAMSDEDRRRFAREARLAARLNHPSIVSIYDHGECGGRMWTSMAYIDGDDTLKLLREAPLPSEWVATIVTDVAEALDFAHARNIVHRDVKPANILVRHHGGTIDGVYIADFGIARKAVGGTLLTMADTLVGSVEYTAPERLTDQPSSGAADQYSLACTAFCLLTGRLPFDEKQLTDQVKAHLHKQPPRAQRLRPDLHWMVDEVLTRAMSKSPAQRYRSCSEFATDLSAALALAPAAVLVGKPVTRRKDPALDAVGASPQTPPPAPMRPRPTPPPRPTPRPTPPRSRPAQFTAAPSSGESAPPRPRSRSAEFTPPPTPARSTPPGSTSRPAAFTPPPPAESAPPRPRSRPADFTPPPTPVKSTPPGSRSRQAEFTPPPTPVRSTPPGSRSRPAEFTPPPMPAKSAPPAPAEPMLPVAPAESTSGPASAPGSASASGSAEFAPEVPQDRHAAGVLDDPEPSARSGEVAAHPRARKLTLPGIPLLPERSAARRSRAGGADARGHTGMRSRGHLLPSPTRRLRRGKLTSTVVGDVLGELTPPEPPPSDGPMHRLWLISVLAILVLLLILIALLALS